MIDTYQVAQARAWGADCILIILAQVDDAIARELAAAAERGQPTMLDFCADWCVSCKEMERYTFSDPAVIAAYLGESAGEAQAQSGSSFGSRPEATIGEETS